MRTGPRVGPPPFGRLMSALLWGLWGALFLGHGGCQPDAAPDKAGREQESTPVLVFAAASTAEALDAIQADWKDQGVSLRISYGSSARLATQITTGAEAEVLLSASEAVADQLAGEDLVADRVNLLGNRLVLVVPADSTAPIERLEDLAGAAVRHVALGDPESVPAGKYAREALEKLGVWSQVQSKVVASADVRQALMHVERGEAEAGIVYSTDAALTPQVRVVLEVPPELTSAIRYPLVLVKRPTVRPEARRVFELLQGGAAAEVFEKYGFEPLAGKQKSRGSEE